jgi:protein-L-isoaspartate(D-aspartate) O-methyltransferase
MKRSLSSRLGILLGLLSALAPLAPLAPIAAMPQKPPASPSDPFALERRQMVDQQIRQRGVHDDRVLDAVEAVPRHLFVPTDQRRQAYQDHPLPIGEGQTISQPYIVALMTSLLDLDGDERVLEIGTGSGYQAAVLSKLARDVYSIDGLGRQAQKSLADLGYRNVHVRIGDGYQGWPEAAPFDGIIVTAAPPYIPEPLIEQLKVGGKLVIPVGRVFQDLLVITKTKDGLERRNVIPVRFVPMTGEVEKEKPKK